MPDYDWNDLRYLLALHRCGSLASAARATGVNETTVARRIRNLELGLERVLIHKTGPGHYVLSEEGRAVLPRAERIETEHLDLQEALGQQSQDITGTVRISSVPFLINHVLIPSFATLRATQPGVQIEFVSEERNVDLSKREADLAIRFARPSAGGLAVKTQKLGDMVFDVYGAAKIEVGEQPSLEWITYDEAHASLPQAAWVEALRARQKGDASALRVADLTSARQAVVAGMGISVLPKSAASRDNQLRYIPVDAGALDMSRPIWLLSHSETHERRAITVVKEWLNTLEWALLSLVAQTSGCGRSLRRCADRADFHFRTE
ncbi:MAG: LysR family transcriptional regulator [Pseudomonadota bacterium]